MNALRCKINALRISGQRLLIELQSVLWQIRSRCHFWMQ